VLRINNMGAESKKLLLGLLTLNTVGRMIPIVKDETKATNGGDER